MKITFGHIQHILALLTTTDWINKYDPKIKLQKLEDQLSNTNDPKNKKSLEKAIENIKQNIDPDKPYILTLEHAGINKNEAQLLLANLHLLYDDDRSYHEESQEALIKLLKLNFDKLNSHEIYQAKTQFHNEDSSREIPADVENVDLFRQLIGTSKIISLLYTSDQELDSTALTRLLSKYFGNKEDAINYLKNVDYTSRETIELSFQYHVPSKLAKEELDFFHNLNSYTPKFGKEILALYANADLLPKTKFNDWHNNPEIQKLLLPETKQAFLKGSKGSEWVTRTLNNLVDEIRQEISSVAYHYSSNLPHDLLPYAEQLSKLSLQVSLDQSSFNKALEFIVQGQLKQSDKMPEINFTFEVRNKEYKFSKLSPSDMRGFVLGKLSNSCQSIGDHSEQCVLDGMSKDTAGFYIITDANGKIRAQSYAWLAYIANEDERYSLVLDSFEHLGSEDIHLFIPAMNQLYAEMPKHNLHNLYVGTGGQTPELHIKAKRSPNPVDSDLYRYGDSDTVYNINSVMSEQDIVSNLDVEEETGLQYQSYQEVYDANTIISAELIIKNHPSEKDYFLRNIEQFNRLLNCITVSEYESYYKSSPELIRYFVYYGDNINDLADIGITTKYLWDAYNTRGDTILDIITNSRSILALYDAGIHTDTLLSLYEDNFSIASTIVAKQDIITHFLVHGASFDTIVDIYKTDIDFMNWLINNIDYTTIALNTGITMDTLKGLHDIDHTIAEAFVLGIVKVQMLVDTEVCTLDDLMKMAQDNPQLITRCIKQADSIILLTMRGIPLSMLVKIFQNNSDLGLFIADNANNVQLLLKQGITVEELLKLTVHKQGIEALKYLVVKRADLIQITENSTLQFKDLLACNIKRLEQLLSKDISPNDLKIVLQNQKKISDLSSLLDYMKEIGLKPDDQKVEPSCTYERSKRAADSCLKEDDKTLRYDPLEEKNMPPEQIEAHRYSEMISLAAIWELSKGPKHKHLQQAIKYHQNIGNVINEGQDNWSTREKKILRKYHKYNQRISAKEMSLLQEVQTDANSLDNYKVKIYDNGKSVLLLFKAPGRFNVYSSGLDYHSLYRIEHASNEELHKFIDAFFMWKDGSSDYKRYTLSKIPHKTLKQIQHMMYNPRKVESDYQKLEKKKDLRIEDMSLDTIHDVLVVDDQPIDVRALTKKFFKIYHDKITLRIDKLHYILPYLDKQEKAALFNIIKKYDLDGSWQKGKVLDEHTSKAMDLYSKAVISEIKEHGDISLNKLSELSWSSLGALIKNHADIGSELGVKIIENTKGLHNSFSTKSVVTEVATQGLFFLPSIIKAVNTNQYQSLEKTGGMVAGDAALNKLVESLAKYLPAERAEVLDKLPITSPIFKALTIYSIIELHQEFNGLPADAPQRVMIKHELVGQYATIGLMCAEMLGIEAGPAWFVLMGVQLVVEAEDMRNMYKLDVSFEEALEMSLGFKQDKLYTILEEREIVNVDLATHQASNMGYTIVQVPKINKIEWQNIAPESIPQDVRWTLSDKAQSHSQDTNDMYSTVESGVYRLTQSYETIYVGGNRLIGPISLVDHSSPKEQWQIKKVYVSPQTSMIKFIQYADDQKHHIESNNWFLGQVQDGDGNIWTRVPSDLESYMPHETPGYGAGGGAHFFAAHPPVRYKKVGPTANIVDPVSRTETGHAALYINQQVIKQDSSKLNYIHFSFDPRRGNITLDITEQGLINMDKTNSAYLASVDNNVNYTSGKAYIFNVLVSKIILHESVEYNDIHHNGNKGVLSVQSDNIRVMPFYAIKYNTPCVIHDRTNMTMIQLLPDQESSPQFKQYLVNGNMQDLKIGTWSHEKNTNYDTTIKMNPDKKYLSIQLDGSLIRDGLELSAASLEVLNVQGRIVNHSILKIAPNTLRFNTTLLGNIIVADDKSTLTLKGLSRSNQIMTFSKSTTLDSVLSYEIKIGKMNNLLENLPENSVNQDISHVDHIIVVEGKVIVQTQSVNYKFSSNGINGHFNTPQHSIMSFSGTIDGKNAVLKSYNNIYVLHILDSNGKALISEYTHYGQDTISIDQSAYITRVFDYAKKSNNMVISNSYVERGSKTTIETYKTHGILNQSRVYEFTTPDGLTITHYYPQDYQNIIVNNIVYAVVKDKIYAIDGPNHVINGNNLLSMGAVGHNKISIYFSNSLENSVVNYNADDLIINGITLHHVAPYINIVFNETSMPLNALEDTIGYNIDASTRSKRSLSQDKVQVGNLEEFGMTSSAIASGSWIKDGVKVIKSWLNTLVQQSFLSIDDQYNESKETMIEFITHNIPAKESKTASKTLNVSQSDNELIVYPEKDSRNITLDNCIIGAQYGREYVDGATCHLPNNSGKVMIFPITQVDTCAAQMTAPQDNYQRNNCTPIEFNGQKSVYCEGEKTSTVYVPIENARLFDNVDSHLMLGRVLFHLIQKTWNAITTTKVVEKKVIINKGLQKQWTHDMKNINNLLQTISQDLELNEADQKIINHLKNVLEDVHEDIDRIVTNQKAVPQTLVDSINNQLRDLEAELTETEHSYYHEAEDSDIIYTTYEETAHHDSGESDKDSTLFNDDLPNDRMYISNKQIKAWSNKLFNIKVGLVQSNTNIYNNIIADVEEALERIRISNICDKEVVCDLVEELHYLSEKSQEHCANINEMKIPDNIELNHFAENQLYSASLLLGNVNNASEINLT